MEVASDRMWIFYCWKCKEMLTPPTYICQVGHTVCQGCSQGSNCPVCRFPSGLTLNTMLEEILSLTFVVCPVASCSQFVSLSCLEKHKNFCPNCPYTSCIAGCGTLVENLGDHLVTEHKFKEKNGVDLIELKYQATSENWRKDQIWKSFVARLGDICMLINAKIDNGVFKVLAYNLKPEEQGIWFKIAKSPTILRFGMTLPSVKDYVLGKKSTLQFNCEVETLLKSFADESLSINLEVTLEKPQ